MKFPRTIILTLAATTAICASADTPQGQLFEYPNIPESIENFTERSNYFIENFWKRANLKSAFSHLSKLNEAFLVYANLMPHADATVVHRSIDGLIKEVNKNPKNMLSLAEIAEGAFYADTARIQCDECYLPFARAVAANGKIGKAERARFEYQAKALEHSQVGMTAPDIRWRTPEGTTGSLSELPQRAYVLLFVNDPDCDDCQLARTRLQADFNLNMLLDKGLIKVVNIYPGEATDEWKAQTAGYNKRWIVGATPDIDEILDMRQTPTFYYLNPKHEILSKTLSVDGLLEAFASVRRKMIPD